MRIWVVGTKGLPANYGGFETFVEQLCSRNYKKRIKFVGVNESSGRSFGVKKYSKDVAILQSPFLATGPQSLLHDAWSLFVAVKKSVSEDSIDDKILLLGTSGGWCLPFLRMLYKDQPTLIVTNIAGLEWTRSKWGWMTRKFLKLSEFLCVRYSDVVVTDNIELKRYCFKEYGVKTHFIPYGGDQYTDVQPDDEFLKFMPEQFDFALARAQPDNNLELLLKAYSESNFNLVLVSNWDSCEFGIDLKNKYLEYANLHLVGPIYEKSKLRALYKHCRLYVHGHAAGGTNPTLVEAMNEGCDVVAFGVIYNIETTQNQALYFSSPQTLLGLLDNWDQSESIERVAKLQSIAKNNYTWQTVCDDYIKLIEDNTL